MRGILVEKIGGEYSIVDTLEKPKPSATQVLVKSLVTGINPVEGFMQGTGQLVTAWPIVLGCDASGIVVETGSSVKKFKQGDGIFGCTRLGVPGHSTFQEYFLMDENLAFKRPEEITVEEAATIGVGLLTACLGLVSGTKINLEPDSAAVPNEWIIVLGAAGSVGQYAVQGSTVPSRSLQNYLDIKSLHHARLQFLKDLGVDATFSYKIPLTEQLAEIAAIAKGKCSRCFDASAMAGETGMEALAQCGDPQVPVKYFATTNDWMPIAPKEDIEMYLVKLGAIGRSGTEDIAQFNRDTEEFIPKLENYLRGGLIKPMEYDIVGGVGVGEVLKGLDAFNARKGGEKKILVRIADD
ncbi:hypothetical protein EG329_012426 [Mollisiaceae sp. DMI_Dod_QoI]|nr:hypothetical protein EG329_012426 [Helotiales sp. DMI_Dod_QoI]